MTESSISTTVRRPVHKVSGEHPAALRLVDDDLAIEDPLEIRIEYHHGGSWVQKTVAMTMRTPGDDRALAVGFLFSEGMITSNKEITEVTPCGPLSSIHGGPMSVRVRLAPGITIPLHLLERNFVTNSACGICGKTSFESLALAPSSRVTSQVRKIHPGVLFSLPAKLLNAQRAFASTGGLHAAALVTFEGTIESLFEDVGRHNAVDKIVGEQLLSDHIPLEDKVILVSGRASYELVQKSVKAGASILVAIGAPSSLALELASTHGMTLIGFAGDQKFNIYTGAHRIET